MNDIQLTFDDLYGQQRQLAETVGMDAYLKLCKIFGGEEIYIQKHNELMKIPRNKEIREKFNGYNCAELARENDLSERYIRMIVYDLIEDKRSAPPEGQLSLWECMRESSA